MAHSTVLKLSGQCENNKTKCLPLVTINAMVASVKVNFVNASIGTVTEQQRSIINLHD